MESWQVLHEAIDPVGVKLVAARLRLSSALVYKWCQEPHQSDPDASGVLNPLDRLRIIFDATRDPRIINWLCHQAGGFYVPNACPPASVDRGEQLLGTTQRVVQDFGQLLTDISRSIENDGLITPGEADTIRQAWETLKSHAECFVTSCERGNYSQPRRP